MDADNLHRRLKKIVGQVQAIDRMVDEDVPCEDVLAQINAAKSALHKCGQVVLEGHIQHLPRGAPETGRMTAGWKGAPRSGWHRAGPFGTGALRALPPRMTGNSIPFCGHVLNKPPEQMFHVKHSRRALPPPGARQAAQRRFALPAPSSMFKSYLWIILRSRSIIPIPP